MYIRECKDSSNRINLFENIHIQRGPHTLWMFFEFWIYFYSLNSNKIMSDLNISLRHWKETNTKWKKLGFILFFFCLRWKYEFYLVLLPRRIRRYNKRKILICISYKCVESDIVCPSRFVLFVTWILFWNF